MKISVPSDLKRWRCESAAGHVVFLFAIDLPHVCERWREFYPNVKIMTMERL